MFNVSSPDCILNNYISQVNDHTHVLVLKQPSLVLPVNDSWLDDKGLQVIEVIKKTLSRQKNVAGLITAGS